jgi:hypothetical protein
MQWVVPPRGTSGAVQVFPHIYLFILQCGRCPSWRDISPCASFFPHSGIVPEIPGELLVKMFIHKAEEKALGIDKNATEKYRRYNQIPDSFPFAVAK